MRSSKVLIYRLGSLGDAIVALPCLHIIARAFPDAERRILTNFPVSDKESPLEVVIGGIGLAHGYYKYPVGSRNPQDLWSLMIKIKHWSPDTLVYLAEPRGRIKAYRDALFFRCCGIRDLIGVPYSEDRQEIRKLDMDVRFESEAHRLSRCIRELGETNLEDLRSWDLHLNEAEERTADGLLWPKIPAYMTASVCTKIEVKDWGEINWASLLSKVSSRYPELGLVLIGAADEKTRSDRVASQWIGPKRNICGLAPPRVSAALLKRSILFVGHDSGPMHLAAAMGVQCVAIFSARNKPGEWFPSGKGHHVFYNQTDCYGCGLNQCIKLMKKCITSISVQEVFDVVCQKLEERWLTKFGQLYKVENDVRPSRNLPL